MATQKGKFQSGKLDKRPLNYQNKRDEVIKLNHAAKYAPALTEINGELLFETITALIKEESAFYIGSLYGGRSVRVRAYIHTKTLEADCDTGPEIEAALQSIQEYLGVTDDDAE